MEPRGLSLRERAGLPMGQGLQVQRDSAASLAVFRHRPQGAAAGGGAMIARRLVVGVATVLLSAFVSPASAADMDKILRVAFVAPETGFDPQAPPDLYS